VLRYQARRETEKGIVMAFRAESVILSRAYIEVKTRALSMKNRAISGQSDMTDNVNSDYLIELMLSLRNDYLRLEELRVMPGLVAYAKDQENDALYDIAAEFSVMQAAAAAAVLWIKNNLPEDGSGYLLLYKTTADADLSPRSFAPGVTAPLVALLGTLEAAIA